jgi:hypothetical protein
MGAKRVSVRTLPSGEKVTHYPPDDAHPEGKMVLLSAPENNLRQRLADQLPTNRAECDRIKQELFDRIEVKRTAQEEHGVPPEKSAI